MYIINTIVSKINPVILWWSGGVTSAVACKIAITWFGLDNVRVIFMETFNEDDDTYRFMGECEKWYGCKIETIYSVEYVSIQEVWYKNLSLNVATGAKCSYELKRRVREKWQLCNTWSFQVFGYDITEIDRAKAMSTNNPECRPLFPLIANLLTKKQCIKTIESENSLFLSITIPRMYYMGFLNNNCFKTGCVQGGIGYWKKMEKEQPAKFDAMAVVEHDLTNLKGEPVTMLKDQGKNGGLVFLKPHPGYPNLKDLSMMKGREVKPLLECNGFCGTNDLSPRSPTEDEINYSGMIYLEDQIKQK